jgi:Macrocin-O-methyltransferase (TylF)
MASRILSRLLNHRTDTRRFADLVKAQNLTYLDSDALELLGRTVREIEASGTSGALIETGCALGGSSLVIARFKDPGRELRLYDTFEQIPSPSDHDFADSHARYEIIRSGKSKGLGGKPYYGYSGDLRPHIERTFAEFQMPIQANNVVLVKGLYQDTLRLNRPVAFAHIDCDWYDSVMLSLSAIVPHLSTGGTLVIDDYYVYQGCRAAVWDFFRYRLDQFCLREKVRLTVTRVKADGPTPDSSNSVSASETGNSTSSQDGSTNPTK